jgi:putative peptidoglycan lipid II flippase
MRLYRSFATVGGYTAISRVLGFLRDMLAAAILGAGPVNDALVVAFRLPNLFRSLFAEGAFNSAFVPMFTKTLQSKGRDSARAFAEEALAVLLLALIVMTALAEIAMPWLIMLIAPGFSDDPDQAALAVLLTRITFPYLLCMSLTALAGGILNALGRFVVAAAAPIILNIILCTALLMSLAFGFFKQPEAAMMQAWAIAVAGFAQLAFLALGARQQGMDLGFRWPRLTPAIRRLFWIAIPGIATAGITQINLFVGTMIASQSKSAVSYIYYADRLNQLPLGMVGIAIGVVLLPELSKKLDGGDKVAAMHSHNRSMEFALMLTLPAAVALMVIPFPIIAVLFQHGAFTAADTRAVSTTLAAFAAGLPASVLIRVFLPGFFARGDTRAPMIYAGISAGVNIAGSLALFPFWGPSGIAAATSAAAWINAIMLGWTLIMRGDYRPDALLERRGPLLMLASAVMGMVLWLLAAQLGPYLAPDNGVLLQVAALAVLVGAGASVYFGAAQLTGAADYRALWRGIARG